MASAGRRRLLGATVVALVAAVARPAPPPTTAEPEVERLRIRGSDTMLPLARRWAEAFMQQTPGVSIDVAGGGTERGLRDLVEGTIDIATASRPLLPEEARALMQRHASLGYSVLVARDALSVYLHPDNPVEALTLEQIRRIFDGTVRHWNEVGGDERPIVVVNRNAASGSRHFFAERVLRGDDFRRRGPTASTTADVLRAVAGDRDAIGFGGIGAARGQPPVRLADVDGVAPSEEHVRDGSYPIARYLYLYTATPPDGAAHRFIDWVLSDEGQRLVAEVGYVPLRPALSPADAATPP